METRLRWKWTVTVTVTALGGSVKNLLFPLIIRKILFILPWALDQTHCLCETCCAGRSSQRWLQGRGRDIWGLIKTVQCSQVLELQVLGCFCWNSCLSFFKSNWCQVQARSSMAAIVPYIPKNHTCINLTSVKWLLTGPIEGLNHPSGRSVTWVLFYLPETLFFVWVDAGWRALLLKEQNQP